MTIGKTGFHLRLRSDLLRCLRLVARREDVTMTSIIEAALENYLASRPDMT
jgi:predicted transcriptional regulator